MFAAGKMSYTLGPGRTFKSARIDDVKALGVMCGDLSSKSEVTMKKAEAAIDTYSFAHLKGFLYIVNAMREAPSCVKLFSKEIK